MSQHRRSDPRDSAPTRIGLGAVEESQPGAYSSGGLTPPRGSDLRGLVGDEVAKAIGEIAENASTARALAEYMAPKLDHHDKWHGAAQDTLVRLDEKVDLVAASQDRTEGAVADLDGRCVVEFARIAAVIGKPPKDFGRDTIPGEHTREQLAILESGTGMAGDLGRLVAGQSRLAARVGLVGVASVTVPQVALALMQSGHANLVGYGAGALVAIAAIARARSGARSLVRRFRMWRITR